MDPEKDLIQFMPAAFHPDSFRFKTDRIFDGLPAKEFAMLNESSVTHHYKKGEIIFREGGIPTGIFYLKVGKVKKYKTTLQGSEQIFYICSAGELLGYHALLGEEHYPDSAATIEDSQITFIPKENFLAALQSSTILPNKLLKILGHEFSVFINSITNLATKSVKERLALNLLILDEKFTEDKDHTASGEINMSRADLANMVGTAKETLVRLLQEFKHNGLIETDGRIIRVVKRKEVIKAANLPSQTLGSI